jgi:hypothetical protein
VRRLVIALVAVDLATEAFKFAGHQAARRRRELAEAAASRAYVHAAFEAMCGPMSARDPSHTCPR